jgi:hypothetical protein
MVEGYSTEEIIKCCLGYLNDKVGTAERKTFTDKDFKAVQQAHYTILQHLTIMTPLVDQHLSMICVESNGRSDD